MYYFPPKKEHSDPYEWKVISKQESAPAHFSDARRLDVDGKQDGTWIGRIDLESTWVMHLIPLKLTCL